MSRTVPTWQMFGLTASGGFVGATLRYATGALAGEALTTTVVVNVTGCFLLGLLLYNARTVTQFSPRFRYLFGAGFCSSWTTYSTFIADVAFTETSVAAVYIGVSYGSGILAVLASYAVGDSMTKANMTP